MGRCCEHGNELSDSIKYWEFLTKPKNFYLLKGGSVYLATFTFHPSPLPRLMPVFPSHVLHSHDITDFSHAIKITISYIISVCLSVWQNAWNNSAPIGRNFMKSEVRTFFFFKFVEKIQVVLNVTRITTTLREYLCTFNLLAPEFYI